MATVGVKGLRKMLIQKKTKTKNKGLERTHWIIKCVKNNLLKINVRRFGLN